METLDSWLGVNKACKASDQFDAPSNFSPISQMDGPDGQVKVTMQQAVVSTVVCRSIFADTLGDDSIESKAGNFVAAGLYLKLL